MMMIKANNSCWIESFKRKTFRTKSSPQFFFWLSVILTIDHLILSFDGRTRNAKRQLHPSLALVGLAIVRWRIFVNWNKHNRIECVCEPETESQWKSGTKPTNKQWNEKKTSTLAESFTSLTEKLVELYQRKAFISHVPCAPFKHQHRHAACCFLFARIKRTCIYAAVVRSFTLILTRTRTESLLIFSFAFSFVPLHFAHAYTYETITIFEAPSYQVGITNTHMHSCTHEPSNGILQVENETAEPMLTDGLFGRFASADEWQKPHLQALCFVSYSIKCWVCTEW